MVDVLLWNIMLAINAAVTQQFARLIRGAMIKAIATYPGFMMSPLAHTDPWSHVILLFLASSKTHYGDGIRFNLFCTIVQYTCFPQAYLYWSIVFP
jgi:hypothetical protein